MFSISTLLICLFAQSAHREFGIGDQPVDVKQIQYTIALDHNEYRPLQDIVVKSTIKNVGDSTIKVPEPSEKASYVSFSVVRTTGAEQEIVEHFSEGEMNPLWNAYIVNLEPGQTTSLSSELFVGGSAGMGSGFDPGEYIFIARYYPDRTPREEMAYVESNHVPFHIRAHTAEEEVEYRDILKARGDVNIRSIYDGASARAFLQKYPDSIYRSLAYGLLGDGRFHEKDWSGQLNYLRPEREALNSDTFTDLSYVSEATALTRLSEPQEAIRRLRETKLANSTGLHESLEAKYGPVPDTEASAAPQPAPVAKAPRGPFWWLVLSGTTVGMAILAVWRYRRRSKP